MRIAFSITTHVCFAACVLLFAERPIKAAEEHAAVDTLPWSGYWWPLRKGGLTKPLSKYDQVVGSHSAEWEQKTHVKPDTPKWFGHCHAWSAASVTEREPTADRQQNQTTFSVGDQKGLLSAIHGQDIANTYGDRFGDGIGTEDRSDIRPDELWHLLQFYLKQQKIPLILDLEAGDEVWNYPIYSYRITEQGTRDDWREMKMELMAADDDVAPNYVGTKPGLHQYTFKARFKDGAIIAGSGEWTGESVVDHPDFAWYPFVTVAENPEIQASEVSKIVGYPLGARHQPPQDGGGSPPSPTPPAPQPPSDASQWRDTMSPEDLVNLVTSKTSHFPLDIFVDRGDGGRYKSGEPVGVTARCGKDGYLYLFDIDPEGDLHLVFPLPGESNQIKKDQMFTVPAKKKAGVFVAAKQGQHDLKGIVTERPIRLTGFHQDTTAPDQRQDQNSQGNQQSQASAQTTTKPRQATHDAEQAPPQLMVHPACRTRCRQRLVQYMRKGTSEQIVPPEKLQKFAQDVSSYFVMADNNKVKPPASTQQSPTGQGNQK